MYYIAVVGGSQSEPGLALMAEEVGPENPAGRSSGLWWRRRGHGALPGP